MPDIRNIADWLQQASVVMALITDAIAVALIAVAIAGAFWRTLEQAWKGDAQGRRAGEGARLRLARSLALGLEFLLADDPLAVTVFSCGQVSEARARPPLAVVGLAVAR